MTYDPRTTNRESRITNHEHLVFRIVILNEASYPVILNEASYPVILNEASYPVILNEAKRSEESLFIEGVRPFASLRVTNNEYRASSIGLSF